MLETEWQNICSNGKEAVKWHIQTKRFVRLEMSACTTFAQHLYMDSSVAVEQSSRKGMALALKMTRNGSISHLPSVFLVFEVTV